MGNVNRPRNVRTLDDNALGKLIAHATGGLYAAAVREMGRRGGLAGTGDYAADVAAVRRGSADMRPVRRGR